MSSTVETMGARDRPDDQMDQLFGDGWPAFITADPVRTHPVAVADLRGVELVEDPHRRTPDTLGSRPHDLGGRLAWHGGRPRGAYGIV